MTTRTLDKELSAQLAELQRERLQPFSREALLWMAIVPRWSEPLAVACGFPVKPDTVAEFVQRAQQAGLCETALSPDLTGSMQLQFWMPESARELVLSQFDSSEVRSRLGHVSALVDGSVRSGVEAPPTVAAWARAATAAATPGTGVGDDLNRQIHSLADAGDTGKALDLIDAVSTIATAVGGEYRSVAARGTRRISLEYRRAHNERALQTFLPRREQIAAFEQLLLGPEPAKGPPAPVWALHYVGMGGVGKTMLIRYLTTRFGPETGRGAFPVARVDFDHVSPTYPTERPGQLLLELADELSAHASSRGRDRLLATLVERVATLHEAAEHSAAAAVLGSPALIDAVDAFGRFVASLPQPVVLFFDTCEELAKFHPPGEEAPGITATFWMLERLIQAVPSARVVFAGRRLLAAIEDNVRAADEDDRWRPVSSVKRPYLTVHEIRGFTREEAHDYLADVRHRELAPGAEAALLGGSLEIGRVSGLERTTADGAGEERYNPYDVALIADLLEDRPELDEEALSAGGTDLYVRLRIVERLTADSELLAALPVAALLGRFDRSVLDAALGAPAEAVFDRIAEQEWAQETVERDSVFLELRPRLRERLEDYYAADDAIRFATLRLETGAGLRDFIAARPLDELRSEHFVAALRLLEPIEAARLWTATAARICDAGAWGWARSVCSRLLGDDVPTGDPSSPVYAGIQATLLGALLHQQPRFDPLPYWRAIEHSAPAYGDPDARQDLIDRARLGRLAGELRGGTDPMGVDEWAFVKRCVVGARADVAGAYASLLEAVLDYSPAHGLSGFLDYVPPASSMPSDEIEKWAAGTGGALNAFMPLLAARCLVRLGRPDEAHAWFKFAAETASQVSSAQRWNDWVAPDDMIARVRLEHLRLASAGPDADTRRVWLDEAVRDLGSIERERLASAIIDLELEHGVLPADVLERVQAHEHYEPARQPACGAHRATPPLFVSLALGWFAAGEAQRAITILERREREATGSRTDPATVSAAQLAILDIARRLRLEARFETMINLHATGTPQLPSPESHALMLAARAAGALIHGEPWPAPSPAIGSDVHDWWQTVVALRPDGAHAALDALRPVPPPQDPLERAEYHVDRCEAREISRRLGFDEEWPESRGRSYYRVDGRAIPFDGLEVDAWERARDAQARGVPAASRHRWARLALRATAVNRDDTAIVDRLPPALGALPPRLLAQLALEEGELLALRSPPHAAKLLRMASNLFEAIGDLYGANTSAVLASMSLIRSGELELARHELDSVDPGCWLGDAGHTNAWRGWSERHRACRAYLVSIAEPGQPPPPTQATRSPEFDLFGAGPSSRPQPKPASAAAMPIRARVKSALPSILGGAIGLGGLGALGALLKVVAGAIGAKIDWLDAVVLASFLVSGLIWLVKLSGRGRGWILRRWAALRVEVLQDAATGGAPVVSVVLNPRWVLAFPRRPDAPARISVSPVGRRLLRLIVRGPAQELTKMRSSPVLTRRQPTAAVSTVAIDQTLDAQLTSLREQVGGGPLDVWLRVPQPLSPEAWERALGGRLATAALTFSVRRLVDALREPPLLSSVADAAIGVVADPVWASPTEATWMARFTSDWSGASGVSAFMAKPSGPPPIVPTVGLLHLVGSPSYTFTTGQWQLRVDARSSSADLESARQAEPTARQVLLAPDRLPVNARYLVVVQDEPEAVAGDELRANGLRAIAAEIAAATATPALTVPALPPELAAAVVGELASRWREAPSNDQLARLAQSLRRRVLTGAEHAAAELPMNPAELALEVALFIPVGPPASAGRAPIPKEA